MQCDSFTKRNFYPLPKSLWSPVDAEYCGGIAMKESSVGHLYRRNIDVVKWPSERATDLITVTVEMTTRPPTSPSRAHLDVKSRL